MARKKLGSVKSVDEVLITNVDLATADVTGVLPVARGGTNLGTVGSNGDVLTVVAGAPAWQTPSSTTGLAYGTWGVAGAEAANKIDLTLTLSDNAGVALAAATAEVEIMVSDSATDAEPSATATIGAAGTPAGTLLSGTGTATATFRCSATGTIAVGVTETAAASRYLWIRQGRNSQFWIRANATPKQITFA